MTGFDALTDASGRSLADHAERLKRTLDGLAERVRDAIAVAVGAAVDGAVQAAVRAALADLAGGAPGIPPPAAARSARGSYWDDPDDGWGNARHERHHNPGRADPGGSHTNAGGTDPRRWAALLVLGGRLAAGWLRHRPPRPLGRAVVCVGLVAALALAGPARPALALTALVAGLHAGGGLIGAFLP